jgi:RNA polymerase sporulation-specific sigma factor
MAVVTTVQPLTNLTDEVLAARYRDGDDAALDALIGRYRRVVRAKARSYFLAGADADDVEQEGLIGLYKAARDFRPGHNASFRGFAELCITRQVVSAIKAAARMKHRPLNSYVSISGHHHGDESAEHRIEAALEDHRIGDPADEVVAREAHEVMLAAVCAALTGLEVEVLGHYADGRSYQEIGELLGRHVKAVDNALQRAKRKLDLDVLEPVTTLVA